MNNNALVSSKKGKIIRGLSLVLNNIINFLHISFIHKVFLTNEHFCVKHFLTEKFVKLNFFQTRLKYFC